MNESFKTDPSLATSARAANESGSYLCASNVTPTAVRFIVSVFLCLLCSCRMSSTQMTCSHFRKNRPKKRQKPAGCRSRIISKNRPVPIFGRSTGASLVHIAVFLLRCYRYILRRFRIQISGSVPKVNALSTKPIPKPTRWCSQMQNWYQNVFVDSSVPLRLPYIQIWTALSNRDYTGFDPDLLAS